MQKPLFERSELFYIGRLLGALLILSGGIALIIQSFLDTRLPASDGYLPTEAQVIDLEQIGSFQNPSFLVTIAYDLPQDDQTTIEVRSGQQVNFEQYFELTIGQVINIEYNPQNTSEWRIGGDQAQLSALGLGALMILLGAFSLGFPTIIRWASREEDFEFKDAMDDVEVSGAKVN